MLVQNALDPVLGRSDDVRCVIVLVNFGEGVISDSMGRPTIDWKTFSDQTVEPLPVSNPAYSHIRINNFLYSIYYHVINNQLGKAKCQPQFYHSHAENHIGPGK
ncbi:hypothetical protein Ga0451573_001015 [Peptococcaceae bacterium DYL19]|nr:hypothetical protein [Phosphitispora fastidiosa]